MSHVVPGNRVGHRNDRALARGISKTFSKARRPRHGGHVQNDAAAPRSHLANAGKDAVVVALHVYAKDAVEFGFGGIFNGADLRNTRVVHKNIEGSAFAYSLESGNRLHLIR